MLQGQQWSLTPDGVLMNGNGYCLEAVPGRPLLVDFASQCAGAPSQIWHYRSGQLISPTAASGTCAVTAAPVVPGAEIVGAACPRRRAASDAITPRAASRWSIGHSAVTTAYGVSVTVALPPGVTAATLSGSGLHCHVGTLTCTGILPAGTSRRITLTGPVPAAIRSGDSYPIRAHATVTGTAQRSRTARTTAAAAEVTLARDLVPGLLAAITVQAAAAARISL
jgi:hypothetical protein